MKEFKMKNGLIPHRGDRQWSCIVVAVSYKRMIEILDAYFVSQRLSHRVTANELRNHWGLAGNYSELIDKTSEGVWIGDRNYYPKAYKMIWPK